MPEAGGGFPPPSRRGPAGRPPAARPNRAGARLTRQNKGVFFVTEVGYIENSGTNEANEADGGNQAAPGAERSHKMAKNRAERLARKAARKRKREFARVNRLILRSLNSGVPISISVHGDPTHPNHPCALLNPPYKTKPPIQVAPEEVA